MNIKENIKIIKLHNKKAKELLEKDEFDLASSNGAILRLIHTCERLTAIIEEITGNAKKPESKESTNKYGWPI